MAATIFAICCFNRFAVEFEGPPRILSMVMDAMMAPIDLRTAASSVIGNDRVPRCIGG
jgi:hypothetical protein